VSVPGWLPNDLVRALRADASALRNAGLFHASGLRDNTLSSCDRQQTFGDQDPLVLTMRARLGGDRAARAAFDEHLACLRVELEATLRRPGLTASEQYFSVHGPGALLRRHVDERHEDTKGERAWTSTTRRSVSWIVYLSAERWGEPGGAGAGGELLAFSRPGVVSQLCGAHRGDVQVGWLAHTEGEHEPVFMDSWVKPSQDGSYERALYRVSHRGRCEMLGRPFSHLARRHSGQAGDEDLEGGDGAEEADRGFTAEELEEAFRAQLPSGLRQAFRSTDTVDGESVVAEVVPAGGTLVVFDSVAVPHEVAPTVRGERFAIAGWFHQRVQDQPAEPPELSVRSV
jgi:hypothetical protein